jgi:hypothetical protein
MLLSRKYNKNIINSAIKEAKKLDRQEILKRRIKKENDRVILAITFNPKLPSVSRIIKKTLVNHDKGPNHVESFQKATNACF